MKWNLTDGYFKKYIDLIFRKKKWSFLFLLIVGVFFCNATFAQRPDSSTGQRPTPGGGEKGPPVQAPRKISKDSLLIFYYFAENPNQEFPYQDTLIDNLFNQFDPARNRLLDYGSLGYLGSPLNPLVYQSNLHRGFDVGLHQYDLYKIEVEDLPFYNLKRAYSDFYFTQGGSQDDIQLKAKFSRNFSKNMNMSFDFQRISQFGTTDPIPYFYPNQRARHTALAGGMTFKNNSNTYQGFFSFSNNIHQQEDNGGIVSSDNFLVDDGFSSTLSIPTWLEDAETRHAEQEVSYTQYYIYNPKAFKENKKRKAAAKAKLKRQRAAAEAARLAALDTLNVTPLPDSLSKLPQDSLGLLPTDSLSKISPDPLKNGIVDSLKNAKIDTLNLSKVSPDTLKNPAVDTLGNAKIDSLDFSKNPTPDSLRNTRPNPAAGQRPRPQNGLPPQVPPIDEAPEGRSYTISHQILYKKGTYKFSDITAAADSLYYKNLLLDERGLRHFVEFRKIENSIAISTFKPRKNSATEAKVQNDFFEVGIRHAFHWIDEEVVDSNVNNLFLTGKWNFAPSERLKVKTYAHLGLWDNAGDYRVSGDFFFDLQKIGQLQLSAVNQLYRPELLQQRFYISDRTAWSNDFKPTLETNLSATYTQKRIGFKVSGQYHLLNNFIYFDTLATAQQESAPVSIFQLIVEQNFRMGKFHLDNVLVFQQTTNDALNLPSIFTKHSFYYQARWFKQALLVRLGADFRMNNNYFANDYNPLVGQFFIQNKSKTEFFPAVDLYANIKVQNFRFFAKAENMTRMFGNLFGSVREDYQYYQVANYPMQNIRFRMGLAWKFAN